MTKKSDKNNIPAKGAAFAHAFLSAYLNPAFGTLSKSEVDQLVFSAMIDADMIDPGSPSYELCRILNITPTRVRSLLLNWQLRSNTFQNDLTERLREALQKTRFSRDGSLLTFGIESPLLKEEVVARLKHQGIYADASFSREVVRLPLNAFMDFISSLVDENAKRDFKQRLQQDGFIKDDSFKSIALGVLTKLGERVAGEAGSALVNEIVGEKILKRMLSNLLKGSGSDAADSIKTLID